MDAEFRLIQKIIYCLKDNKVVLLCTCASAWQNEFISEITTNRSVFDLSDPMIRERAMRQPDEFVRKLEIPAVLYNLQYAPELLQYLSADDVPNGAFIAVVNQSYYVMPLVEQLKDVVALTLPLQPVVKDPFLPSAISVQLAEYSSGNILEKILQGELSADNFSDVVAKDKFYANYLNNFLQRNIKDFTTVSDEMRFYRFVCAVAGGIGSAVNYANLANAADITSPTAKQWLKFLEGTGAVYLLWPIEHTSLKRVAKAPKVYFADTGLAAYLLRVGNTEELSESTFFGALFENYVVNAIKDSYVANGFDVDLSYFRDSNAKEINLLLRYNDVIYPIEIRKDPVATNKLRKKFKLLKDIELDGVSRVGVGCVIGLGKRQESLADDLLYVPVGSLG